LFGIGVVKTRWTKGNPVVSGVEILLVGAFAGIVGFLFGNLLPQMLGVSAPAG
jgi:VIT1/CCC1 family predicted Fe2+/Mn2+ transporter